MAAMPQAMVEGAEETAEGAAAEADVVEAVASSKSDEHPHPFAGYELLMVYRTEPSLSRKATMPTMARALVRAAMTAIVQLRRGGGSSAFLLVSSFDRRARPSWIGARGPVWRSSPVVWAPANRRPCCRAP